MPSPIVVLMPCAGDGRYFATALRSALDQTWSNITVVVVDNASETSIYQDQAAKANDLRVRYFREDERVSMALNWQRCLKYAGLGYFCFLHDDDYWDCNYLERAIKIFERNPEIEAVLTAHGELVEANGQNVIGPPNLEWNSIWKRDKSSLTAALLLDDWGHMSATVFRKCEFSFDLRSVWMFDQIYISNYLDFGKLSINPSVLVGIRRHASTGSVKTPRHVRVLERDQVLRRALHFYRESHEFKESTRILASQNGEMAFRLFRGVCTWPLNLSVIKEFKRVIEEPAVLKVLETRFYPSAPARYFGIGWLLVLSLAIDFVYLLRISKSRFG